MVKKTTDRVCPNCGAQVGAGNSTCAACGHVLPLQLDPPRRGETPAPIVAETTEEQLLALILEEQRTIAKTIRSMNTVIQLFGLLLLLAIAGIICNLTGLI